MVRNTPASLRDRVLGRQASPVLHLALLRDPRVVFRAPASSLLCTILFDVRAALLHLGFVLDVPTDLLQLLDRGTTCMPDCVPVQPPGRALDGRLSRSNGVLELTCNPNIFRFHGTRSNET